MAAPGGGKGAWALLAVALLVPCFLFYQWWARMDKAKKEALNQKIRSRGVNAFDGAGKNKERLNNPIAGQDAAAAVQVAAAVAPVPADPAAGAAPGVQPPAPAAPDASLQAAPPAAVPEGAPAMEQPAPGGEAPAVVPPAEVAVATAAPGYYLSMAGMPDRDPTLSPYDFLKLRRAEEERLARILELQERNKPKPVKKRVEPPIENTIDLQGIVSNAEGENRAIINGEIFGEGELVDGKVKVLRIGAQSVVFAYKSKRFTMSVNK